MARSPDGRRDARRLRGNSGPAADRGGPRGPTPARPGGIDPRRDGSPRIGRPQQTELRLLGGFELACCGEPVFVPLSVQRLVAFLALHDRPLQRVYVAGSLWLDASEERAFANLRSTLWRSQQCGQRLVTAASSQLGLSADLRVDLHEATAQARRLVDGSAERGELRFDTLPLSGELLPDWYEDWVVTEREHFRQLWLHALEALAKRLIELEQFAEAVEAATVAVATDPLRESAQRWLIRAHLAEGNTSEAIRQYHRYRELLAKAIGLAPSTKMEGLVQALRRD
jgi:DNA-binding SARP family transcriptional activator